MSLVMTAALHVSVGEIEDGEFVVELTDPFAATYGNVGRRTFKAGQDPTDWITRKTATHMRKWLKRHHKPQPQPKPVPAEPRFERCPYEWGARRFDPYYDDYGWY